MCQHLVILSYPCENDLCLVASYSVSVRQWPTKNVIFALRDFEMIESFLVKNRLRNLPIPEFFEKNINGLFYIS